MLWNNLTLDFCKVTVDYLVCMPMKEDSRGACNYCQSAHVFWGKKSEA